MLAIHEIHLEGHFTDAALRDAVGHVLGLADVAICDDEESIPAGTQAVAVVRRDEGEFGTHLTLYRLPEEFPDGVLAELLSQRLHCRCLISGHDANPYRWVLVSDGAETPVFVQAALFDEQQVLTLDGSDTQSEGK